jgi:hypothetical protein
VSDNENYEFEELRGDAQPETAKEATEEAKAAPASGTAAFYNLPAKKRELIKLDEGIKILTSKNDVLNFELRELDRLRKDRYNTVITFVVCTCFTVWGGIIIASDTAWWPFHLPSENNRYLGMMMIFLAVIFGPALFSQLILPGKLLSV